MQQLRLSWLAGLACLVAAPLAPAQDIPATPRSEIRFDPATERAFDRTGRYVTVTRNADGSVLNRFNGSMANVTVARLGPDGQVETYCTTDQEDATRWMAREDAGPRPQVSARDPSGSRP